jgi:hypothetical protein
MRLHGFQQEGKHGTTLLDTGSRYCPEPLAPVLPLRAPRPQGHTPVDGHEAYRLFGQVIGGVHIGFGDETEIAVRVVGKTFSQVACFTSRRQTL